MMAYTVKQLSDLAGVSVRTLHYYDEIDLLKPSRVGDNGYRYYEDAAVYRLQQILFFRELDMNLDSIRSIVEQPDFDVMTALQAHRTGLLARIRRLHDLIQTIDSTILHLTGETDMDEKQFFKGFDEATEQRYAEEARQRWGQDEVNASYKLWNSYSDQKKAQIKAEGGAVYQDLAENIAQGAESAVVQGIIARWHQHMRYFYEPSIERLRGLSQHYVDSPDFAERFRALHPDLPEFMQAAITFYCDKLEAAE